MIIVATAKGERTMELNREQIIKALECCVKVGKGGLLDDDCNECPYDIGKYDCKRLDEYAIALIKELGEENERLIADNSALLEAMHTPHKDPEGTFRIKLNVPNGSGITYHLRSAKQIKLDTVGEMSDRIKEYFPCGADSRLYVVLDQIIKEMLGVEK